MIIEKVYQKTSNSNQVFFAPKKFLNLSLLKCAKVIKQCEQYMHYVGYFQIINENTRILQYLFIKMEEDLFISVLKPLSPQAKEDLNRQQIEAECIFALQPDCEDEDQFVRAQNPYLLQIRKDFLVQCEPKSKKICGGILLTLDYKFEIIRYAYDPESEVGRPYALILYFPQNQDQQQSMILKFGVDEKRLEDLQKFIYCLQTKNIIQKQNDFKNRIFTSKSVAVYSALRSRDNKQFAIKCLNKDVFFMNNRDITQSLQREYGIPRKLKHKNIVELYSIYENQTVIFIILERLHLNFLQFLQANQGITKQELKCHFHKICLALSILHQNFIMHRDIKPENIMMKRIGDSFEPVLIDFGLSQYQYKKPYLLTRCGTIGYVAPEIVQCIDPAQADYNRSCDIFSLGCMLHFVMVRRPLFDGKSQKQVIQKNRACNINPNAQLYKNLRAPQKDLLFKMLEVDSKKRITIKQILNHQYFSEFKQPIQSEKAQRQERKENILKEEKEQGNKTKTSYEHQKLQPPSLSQICKKSQKTQRMENVQKVPVETQNQETSNLSHVIQ